MLPKPGKTVPLQLLPDPFTTKTNNENFTITASNGVGAVHYENVSSNCRITLQINPKSSFESYGLILRADEKGANGYNLLFSANDYKVSLGNTTITGVNGLNHAIQVDIIMKDNIIDVCVDNRRCIVNRVIEHNGNNLWLYAKHGNVDFKSIKISGIESDMKLLKSK